MTHQERHVQKRALPLGKLDAVSCRVLLNYGASRAHVFQEKLTAPGLEEWTGKIQNGKTSVKFSKQSDIK